MVLWLQTIHELQEVRQQLSHVTDTATASKVLLRVEKQLKSQTQVFAYVAAHCAQRDFSLRFATLPICGYASAEAA